jgi:peptide/nickel transport system substrate-binding protein
MVTPRGFIGIKNKWQNIQLPPIGKITWNLEEIWEENENP